MAATLEVADPAGLLTSSEVARLLRVHPKHVYRLLRRGMPARRVGGKWLFSREEVLAWARSGQHAPLEGAPEDAPGAQRAELAPLVASDADPAVELLLRLARWPGHALVGFMEADRAVGLELLESGQVLACGWGGHSGPPSLSGERLARLHLAYREVGVALRPGLSVSGWGDLAQARLIVREPTAGEGEWLVKPLRQAGVDVASDRLPGLAPASPSEVASALLQGLADAGPLTRAWATRFGLGFRSLGAEPFGLLVTAKHLGDPRIVRLCETAQSEGYRQALGRQPGYQTERAGELRIEVEPR